MKATHLVEREFLLLFECIVKVSFSRIKEALYDFHLSCGKVQDWLAVLRARVKEKEVSFSNLCGCE